MGKQKSGNTKVEAGNAKKAENARKKADQEAQKMEQEEAKEWQQGADLRGQKRSTADAEKELARMAKAAEKKKLMEEEAKELSAVAGPKKSGGKKKTEIPPWEAALQGVKKPAGKKSWQVEEEEEKKKDEEQQRLEARRKEQASLAKAMAGMDTTDFMAKANLNRGKVVEGEDGSLVVVEDDWASGLDAALDSLVLEHRARTGAAPAAASASGAKSAAEGGKNLKALYRAYEDKKLIVLRAEQPGLRLRQYRERIFDMWKRSPENPLNVVRMTDNAPVAEAKP